MSKKLTKMINTAGVGHTKKYILKIKKRQIFSKIILGHQLNKEETV